ncbi:threonine aspartase 1-like [Tubulanus polymorphus]|uniref:threonine aspartase 1-like n=1 Tax=Tubulanus polymorphus TaxID=672921 RepID=UPI003DA50A03
MNGDIAMTGVGLVAVHVGAGYHSEAKAKEYKRTCQEACLQAIKLLKKKENVVSAVVAAILSLEDSECTNAGLGSNLTLDGCVECDASVMDGKTSHYGATGALSGIKNPIQVAEALLKYQSIPNTPLGRIPPCILVGKGAFDWAVTHGIAPCPASKMITDSSLRSYKKHRRKLDELTSHISTHQASNSPSKIRKPEELCSLDNSRTESVLNDTVGAICVDEFGNVAAAVSSGGIILKHSGRLGQAAMYGCGCWAQNGTKDEPSVAVSTSGCGEHLIRSLLAKECADSLVSDSNPSQAITGVLTKNFLGAEILKDIPEKLGGILALCCTRDGENLEGELLWAHTTETMCIGFMSTLNQQAKSCISHLSDGAKAGQTLNLEGTTFRWKIHESTS